MSRLKHYLNEKYIGRVKTKYSKSSEIFVNPSFKEMREVGPEIRFIADSRDKKLYVWNIYSVLHFDAWLYIKPTEDDNSLAMKGTIFEGEAQQSGGSFTVINSNILNTWYDTKMVRKLQQKFKWVNKYINIDVYFDYWIHQIEEPDD